MPRPPSRLRRAAAALGSSAAVPLTAAVGATAAYLGVLTVAGLVAGRRRTGDAATPATRFAVLVPAHDEEAVIAQSVASMVAIDYPTELFSVHVVADNCRDRTVQYATQAGAQVHVRVAPDDPGKGAALNWLYDRLVGARAPADAFVIVDADTIVDPGFLRAMDRAIQAGAAAAQGFYDVRDPASSPAASLRAAALACRHHLRPLGRTALGASCGLYGNGMAFTSAVLAEHRWTGHLTEDLEMQVALLLDGRSVAYVPDAQVAAEMPDTLEASVTQHQRWEAGRTQVLRTELPRLLGALRRGEGSRLAVADTAADLLVPPLSVLVAAQAAAGVASGVAYVLAPTRARRAVLAGNVAAGAVVVGHVFAGLRSVGAPASTYRALASAPRMVLWKLGLWHRVVADGDDIAWTRTARNAEASAGGQP